MSTRSKMTPASEVFPFGFFSLSFAVISILLTSFFTNPANDPRLIELADFLLKMGLVALIFILFVFVLGTPDRTPIMERMYNPVGMWIAFLVGMGFPAILMAIAPTFAVLNPFSNYDVNFSTMALNIETLMFLVATIEELTFRVALAMIIYIAFPSKSFWIKILASILLSNGAFAFWHWWAYKADFGMMVVAFIAGLMFTLGYQAGARMGGGELSFVGIVMGHWLWNITAFGTSYALVLVFGVLFVMTLFILLVNPHSMRLLVGFISRVVGGR